MYEGLIRERDRQPTKDAPSLLAEQARAHATSAFCLSPSPPGL